MIVPRFWAEGRVSQRAKGRQVTVRRFGWSNTSVEDARQQADLRARAAFDRVWAGEKLPRREPKLPYNGAEGVPIREEIVSEHGSEVITRNLYGALCLNTPDVLFADVDFDRRIRLGCRTLLGIGLLGGVFAGVGLHSVGLGVLATFVLPWAVLGTARFLQSLRVKLDGGAEAHAMKLIRRFVTGHPDWTIRVYRTPAGLRALAVHRKFVPGDAEAQAFFDAIDADPVYVRMCKNQQCFRARVSPKPWRIGIPHVRPRPGVWPVDPAKLPQRLEWIARYEETARGFSSCHFIEALGGGITHEAVRPVQELHDRLARATESLPLA